MIDTAEAYGFTFAFPARDTTVGRCLRDHGEFGRIGMLLASQLSRGGVFIDIGANVGAYSLPVSRAASRVIAVEAHAGLAGILLDNVTANRVTNVEVLHAAAGSASGSMAFPTPALDEARNFGATGVGTSAPLRPTRVLTVDEIAPAETRCVKIDVEGAEPDVLAGASQTLERVRPAWIVEANSPTVAPALRQRGYMTYWLWDPFVTPAARTPWRGKRLGDLSILAVPAEQPQPQQMVEAHPGDSPPLNTLGFGYLRAFGIRESS